MAEYRTVLGGIPLDRPVQAIHKYPGSVQAWTIAMLKAHPLAIVYVYQSQEILVNTIIGEARKARVSSATMCQNCPHHDKDHIMTSSSGHNKFGACNRCECRRFRPGGSAAT